MDIASDSTPVTNEIRLTPREVRFYQEEGYLVLPGLVREAALADMREEVFTILEANGLSRDGLRKASGPADRLRQCSKYLAGSKLDRLINGGAAAELAAQLIGGRAIRYLPFTAVKAGGGGGTFDYHQDNNYTNHDPAMGSINIWVALVDVSPANGCLQIIPKSHINGQIESYPVGDGHRKLKIDEAELLPIRMRAGDAVAFTRWTVHGSGPNDTDQARLAYALQYHREDVKWKNPDTGEWRKLVDTPRSVTTPAKTREELKAG